MKSFLLVLLLAAKVAWAEDAPYQVEPVPVEQGGSEVRSAKPDYLSEVYKQYGLTQQEWTRFEAIKAGPIGNANPNINPLLALAMMAPSYEDERRYMEQFARLKHDLTERALALSRRWPGIYFGLYPHESPIDKSRLPGAQEGVMDNDRFVLVTKSGCNCPEKLRVILTRTKGFPKNPVDIYVQDLSDNDDLMDWAQRNVPPSEVQRVTVNPGSVYLSDLVTDGKTMALVVSRGDKLLTLNGLESLLL